MIDAAKARRIAREVIETKAQSQVEEVEEQIMEEAEKGNMYCQMEGYLLPQVVEYLKALGYNTKHQTARNESWTTISWSDETC